MSTSIDVFTNPNHFKKGGKWSCHAADVATKFPGCKMLMHQDDLTSGDTEWVDRVAGLVLTDSTAFTKTASGIYPTSTSSVSVTTGALPIVGANDAVMLIEGIFTNAGAVTKFGEDGVDGPGMGVSGNNASYIIEGAAYYLSDTLSAAPTYPASGAMSLHFDLAGAEARKQFANAAGTEIGTSVKNGVGSVGTIASLSAFDSDTVQLMSGGSSATRLIALWVFSNPVTDAAIATKWMAANPGKLYPGWAGKT